MPQIQINRVSLAHHLPSLGSLILDEDEKRIEFQDVKGKSVVLATEQDPIVKVTWSPLTPREGSLQLYLAGYDTSEVLVVKEEKLEDEATLNGVDKTKKPASKVIPRFYRINDILLDRESKIREFCRSAFGLTLEPELWNLRGGNYGQLQASKLKRSILLKSYDDAGESAIEIPLANVSQVAVPGKNDVEIQYTPLIGDRSDRFELSLVRLYIPDEDGEEKPQDDVAGGEDDGEDTGAPSKWQSRMKEISDLYEDNDESALGLICNIDEEWCNFSAPKGKFRVQVFKDFFRMRGKTYDHKVPYANIVQLHLLEHAEMAAKFLVISLNAPIRAGQKKYNHLVMTISDEEGELQLELSDEALAERYPESTLTKTLKGKMPEIIAKLLKGVSHKKVFIMPTTGFFAAKPKGEDEAIVKARSVKCSFKANQGFLFPMKSSMMFLHNPVLYLRYAKIDSVEFRRHQTGNRTFDLVVTMADTEDSGLTSKECEFAQISKDQFEVLSKFFAEETKITIKNKKQLSQLFARDAATGKSLGLTIDDLGDDDEGSEEEDSDFDEDKFKKAKKSKDGTAGEGKDGEDDDDDDEDDGSSGGSGSSSDDDDDDSDMAEEVSVDSDELRAIVDETIVEGKRKRKAAKGESKKKSVGGSSKKKGEAESPSKKKKKDPNAPKAAKNAYAVFLEEKYAEAKANGTNEGKSFGEMTKMVSEMWKQLDESGKVKYEEIANKDKERFRREMDKYKADHPDANVKSSPMKKKKDRDAPKGSRSAFNYYTEENRGSLKDLNLSFGEISRKLADMWKALPDADKQKYNDMAAKDKERHAKEMEEYEAKGGDSSKPKSTGEKRKSTASSSAAGASKAPSKKKVKALGGGELPSEDEDSSSDDSSSDDHSE